MRILVFCPCQELLRRNNSQKHSCTLRKLCSSLALPLHVLCSRSCGALWAPHPACTDERHHLCGHQSRLTTRYTIERPAPRQCLSLIQRAMQEELVCLDLKQSRLLVYRFERFRKIATKKDVDSFHGMPEGIPQVIVVRGCGREWHLEELSEVILWDGEYVDVMVVARVVLIVFSGVLGPVAGAFMIYEYTTSDTDQLIAVERFGLPPMPRATVWVVRVEIQSRISTQTEGLAPYPTMAALLGSHQTHAATSSLTTRRTYPLPLTLFCLVSDQGQSADLSTVLVMSTSCIVDTPPQRHISVASSMQFTEVSLCPRLAWLRRRPDCDRVTAFACTDEDVESV